MKDGAVLTMLVFVLKSVFCQRLVEGKTARNTVIVILWNSS